MLYTMQLFPARHTEVSIIHTMDRKLVQNCGNVLDADNTSLVILEDVSMIIDPNYIF